MGFTRAVKSKSKLRLAFTGPSGSGKTYSALAVACALGRCAVLDTEHGSATLYADAFEFDVHDGFKPPWHPDTYIQAMREAAKAGYDVIVIDSLSHAWAGQGGLLEEVDKIAQRSKSGSSFNAWRDATPIQHRLIEEILGLPCHVVVTMRSKTEWVLDQVERGGRTVTQPRKVGLAPVQRDGIEYEWTVSLDLDHDHRALVSKTRCSALDGAVIHKPGKGLAEQLREWLERGEIVAPQKEEPRVELDQDNQVPQRSNGNGKKHTDEPASEAQIARLKEYEKDEKLSVAWRVRITHLLSKPITKGKAGAMIAAVKQHMEQPKTESGANT